MEVPFAIGDTVFLEYSDATDIVVDKIEIQCFENKTKIAYRARNKEGMFSFSIESGGKPSESEPLLSTDIIKINTILEFERRLKSFFQQQPLWNVEREGHRNLGLSYDDVMFGVGRISGKMQKELTYENKSD